VRASRSSSGQRQLGVSVEVSAAALRSLERRRGFRGGGALLGLLSAALGRISPAHLCASTGRLYISSKRARNRIRTVSNGLGGGGCDATRGGGGRNATHLRCILLYIIILCHEVFTKEFVFMLGIARESHDIFLKLIINLYIGERV
jgi:hypothetical protein